MSGEEIIQVQGKKSTNFWTKKNILKFFQRVCDVPLKGAFVMVKCPTQEQNKDAAMLCSSGGVPAFETKGLSYKMCAWLCDMRVPRSDQNVVLVS